jgi:VWFA-related protein
MHDTVRIGGRVVFATVLACSCVLAARAQQKPPAFRSGVVLVPVDVRVLDAEGRPVPGLSADDFVVMENGVRQKISHFHAYTLEPDPEGGADPALRERPATSPTDIVPPKGRVFLVVLGRGRQNDPSKGPEAVARFIRQQLLPQDRVAVLAWWKRATDFTPDHEKVAQVIDRFKVAHEAIEAGVSQRLSGLAGLFGDPDSSTVSEDQLRAWVFSGASSKTPPQAGGVLSARANEEMRRNATKVQAGEIARDHAADSAAAGLGGLVTPLDMLAMRDAELFDVSFDRYVSETVQTSHALSSILTGIEYLRHIEGEKHLIFLTEQGIYLPRLEDDLGIAAIASDARVVLHTVQTGGIPGPPPHPETFAAGFARTADKVGPTLSQIQAITTLKTVSELTGGISSTMAYADRAMSRIDQASRSGYLLGYYPADSKWNGAYRRIAIRVNRSGATVLFRHGYYAKDTFVPLNRRAFFTFNRIAAAAASPRDSGDIRITVESATAARNEKGVLEAAVDVRVDLSAVTFRSQGDRQVASIDISVFCGDSKDNLVGESWQKADLALKPETYQRLLRDGLSRTVRVPLKAPAANVKVIVYDYAADRLGSATAKTQMVR